MAVLCAARVGVEVPSDVTIRVRELGGERGGGFDGDGISKAVVDVASPEARSEQAEGGHERAAVCAEELIDRFFQGPHGAVLFCIRDPLGKENRCRTSCLMLTHQARHGRRGCRHEAV